MPAPSILPLINAAALALAIVSLTLSWYLVALVGLVIFLVHARDRGSRDTRARHRRRSRWITTPLAQRSIGFPPTRGATEGRHQRRAGARRALLRGVRGLPRPTAASARSARPTTSAARPSPAHLSVLDLAEAHHAALRAALGAATTAAGRTLQAAADFLRESLSTFETVHRGYLEVQEVARLEHEYVEQLRALADASVAINSSLTVEEILQLTADAARDDHRAPRARPSRSTRPTRGCAR